MTDCLLIELLLSVAFYITTDQTIVFPYAKVIDGDDGKVAPVVITLTFNAYGNAYLREPLCVSRFVVNELGCHAVAVEVDAFFSVFHEELDQLVLDAEDAVIGILDCSCQIIAHMEILGKLV